MSLKVLAMCLVCVVALTRPLSADQSGDRATQPAPKPEAEAAPEPVAAKPEVQVAPKPEAPVKQSGLEVYGTIREDFIFDNSQPNAFQTPMYILSEPADGASRRNLTIHPRLTRLGMNVGGRSLNSLGGGRISAKLEVDFQNGGSESRAVPRFRHAYLAVAWRSASVLVGQTWDLISPLFPAVNADTLMWNAGNLGDRRPQFRVVLQPPSNNWRWSLGMAAGLTGAVDGQDLDNDRVRDGEAAGVPNLQLRLGVSRPLGAKQFSAGVWGYVSQTRVSAPIAGKSDFASQALGVDLDVPLGRRISARGELWTGQNLSDVRGGIGQSINPLTGARIKSSGGWGELGAAVLPQYSLSLGYTLDAPVADAVPNGGRTRNGAWYLVNRWTAADPLVVGVDYLRWQTKYRGSATGLDHRVNAYVTFSF